MESGPVALYGLMFFSNFQLHGIVRTVPLVWHRAHILLSEDRLELTVEYVCFGVRVTVECAICLSQRSQP